MASEARRNSAASQVVPIRCLQELRRGPDEHGEVPPGAALRADRRLGEIRLAAVGWSVWREAKGTPSMLELPNLGQRPDALRISREKSCKGSHFGSHDHGPRLTVAHMEVLFLSWGCFEGKPKGNYPFWGSPILRHTHIHDLGVR